MNVSEGIGRDILRLIVWYPLRWLLLLLPLGMGFKVIRLAGTVDYHLHRSKTRKIKENIASVFSMGDGRRIDGIIRWYMQNHYANQLQIILFPRFNRTNVERFHGFEGIERLDAALAVNKGCILVHPHFGPAQMPLHVLGVLGYRMMQVGLLHDEDLSYIGKKVAFRLRERYEAMIKADIVRADIFLRPVFKWLKSNGVVMMTGDGAGGGKSIGRQRLVRFLDGIYPFPMGSATLAAKTGAPLCHAFVTQWNGRYTTIIEEPMFVANTEEDINRATEHFARRFEVFVKDQPWLWHFLDELDEKFIR